MKKIVLLSLLLALVPLIAFTAQWFLVYSDNDEQGLIDTDSMKTEGQLVYYCKKTILTNPESGYKKIYGAKAYSTLTDVVENCHDHTSKILHITLKDMDGNTLMEATTPGEVAFMPIIENSKAEKSHQYVCANIPQLQPPQ